MSQATPIPRDTRARTIAIAPGQSTFGPIDVKIYDVRDVRIDYAPTPASAFADITSTCRIALTGAAPSGFTIERLGLAAGGLLIVRGLRAAERSSDVTLAGVIRASSLERELDRQTVTDQELRRDIDDLGRRVIALPYGEAGATLPPAQARANRQLMFDGDGRPIAGAIGSAPLAVPGDGTVTFAKLSASLQQRILTVEDLTAVSPAARPLFVISTGQSNAGLTAPPAGDLSTEPGVFVWEQIPGPGQTTGWKEAGPDSPDWPFLGVDLKLFYTFCRALRRATGQPVYLVNAAQGGQQIAQWRPGGGGVPGATGAMYVSLYAAVRDALASPQLASWGISVPEYFLWHQGEGDRDGVSTSAQYRARFQTLFNEFRTPNVDFAGARVIGPATRIVLGELAHGGTSGGNPTDSRNPDLEWLAAADPRMALARAHDLPMLDTLHFSSIGLETFGYRYFNAAMHAGRVDRLQADNVWTGRNTFGGLQLTRLDRALPNGVSGSLATPSTAFVTITGPTAAFTLRSMLPGIDGQVALLVNMSGQVMTIEHESASELVPERRFSSMTGANLVSVGNAMLLIAYHAGVQRWLVAPLEL
jgi:hypothetical protein